MRIAQLSALELQTPPSGYGATERLVSYLTEELVARGHEVTLFAAPGSQTGGTLVETTAEEFSHPAPGSYYARYIPMYERVFADQDRFDVIHNHSSLFIGPVARREPTPTITTLEHSPDTEWFPLLAREFTDLPTVALSRAQRAAWPTLNWAGIVAHGLPADLYTPTLEVGSYLAFVGRLIEDKGVDDAIEMSLQTGIPLKVAGSFIDVNESRKEHLLDLFRNPLVEYVGEISDAEKGEFFGGALGLLFPIHAAEAFGLVLIEALACGTPIIAYPLGSVPEVVSDGITGRVVDSISTGVAACSELADLDRAVCRQTFEENFTATVMAERYEALYRSLTTSEGD